MNVSHVAPVELRAVTRTFDGGKVRPLEDVDLSIEGPGSLALIGASGSGKTTLLNIVGLLDEPDAGTVLVGGAVVSTLDDRAVTRLRARHFGFVFQDALIDPRRTARENVTLGLAFAGIGPHERGLLADEALGQTDMSHRANTYAGDLSGGERQRVAVARAIAHRPPVLLCDEPTGNLDPANTERVFALLSAYATTAAVVVVTHDLDLAQRCARALRVTGGGLRPAFESVVT